uniref:Nuclease HARBI1 n=1 Tax=Diabrotica virgifera virgifera TaxID=50390 RepID=A0A6P7GW89_DIAVI
MLLRLPQSESEWEEIAKEFDEKWNFCHCIGAVDGKHITIEKPPGSGSLFYNYKGFYSVILFAIVNPNYEFLYVQTGTNGAVNDSGVFETTTFYQKFMNGYLNFSAPSPLPGAQTPVPYVLLGDSAFPINKHFMKPFPSKDINKEQRIFNYRLSRARRIVENAFGIIRPINLDLENVDAIILACCALHNYLRKRAPRYITTKLIDRENTSKGSFTRGHWRNCTDGLHSLNNTGKGQRNEEGKQVRDTFMKYFNSNE